MLLLSAAAVSVLWIIRLNGTTSAPYVAIMTVPRYMAYASLAVVMIFLGLFSLARSPRFRRLHSSARLAIPLIVLVFSTWTSMYPKPGVHLANSLAVSAAGLSIGLSPYVPVVNAIWADAAADWYWKTELSHTVMFMRIKQKAYWDKLPPLNSTLIARSRGIELGNVVTKDVLGANLGNRCEFEAQVAARSKPWFTPPAPMAVTNANGVVVGYGVELLQARGNSTVPVKGYVLCDNSRGLLTLNLDNSNQKVIFSGNDIGAQEMPISDANDAA
jgi:hypothetical protein